MPPESTLRVWAWEYETGLYAPHEKIDRNMEKKLQVYPKWRQFQMIEKNMRANESLTARIEAGTFDPAMTAALQHTSNAVNYGIQTGARANAEQGKQTINFNNFKMITGGKKLPGRQQQTIPAASVKVLSIGKPGDS